MQEEEEKQPAAAAAGKKRKGLEPAAPKHAPGVKKVGWIHVGAVLRTSRYGLLASCSFSYLILLLPQK